VRTPTLRPESDGGGARTKTQCTQTTAGTASAATNALLPQQCRQKRLVATGDTHAIKRYCMDRRVRGSELSNIHERSIEPSIVARTPVWTFISRGAIVRTRRIYISVFSARSRCR